MWLLLAERSEVHPKLSELAPAASTREADALTPLDSARLLALLVSYGTLAPRLATIVF